MVKYKHNMSGESQKKKLLPEGWRTFKIIDGEETTSKAGNPMFKFIFRDLDTQQDEEVYAIVVEGKRWFLKQILCACQIKESEDGVFEWGLDDVVDREIMGLVTHVEEEWINREGVTIKSTKHKIAEVNDKVPF